MASCSSFPEGDPNPGTVRVFLDGDFDQTWQLAPCDAATATSLSATASNAGGDRLVIEIADEAGRVTVFEGATTVGWTGTIEDFDYDAEEQLFEAEGQYAAGDDEGKLELEGNCAAAS